MSENLKDKFNIPNSFKIQLISVRVAIEKFKNSNQLKL